MTRLAFIDTETTSLRPDRRAWEVALIVRDPGGPDTEHVWTIHTFDLDLGNADPFALRIGRFYDRHPEANGKDDGDPFGTCALESSMLRDVERLTRDAHLVGAVPNFDADVLGTRMRAHGILPSWHYHLIDVEALAVGWVSYKAKTIREADPDVNLERWPPLPWQSDQLSRALGVEVDADAKHTALGDARWARAMYDKVTGHG